MTDYFTEDDILATVSRLSQSQLVRFVEFELVRPQHSARGYIFRRIDIARLELLCDLSHDLDLDEAALGIVLNLLDQLHAARSDLAAVTHAMTTVPSEVRHTILAALERP